MQNGYGQRIAMARAAKGWSQTDLANKIGSTQQQVARYESGENDVKSSALLKMSAALNVTVSYLLSLDDSPQPTETPRIRPAPGEASLPLVGSIAAGIPREVSIHKPYDAAKGDDLMKLAEYRRANGLTQEEVALILGIPKRTYQNYEYEYREAGNNVLCSLADHYGVTLDDLVGHEPASAGQINANRREGALPNAVENGARPSANLVAATRKRLADNLGALRRQNGMSVSEVGTFLGKSGKTISAWEVGRGQPNAGELVALCDLFSVDLDTLLGARSAKNALAKDEAELVEFYRKLSGIGKLAAVASLSGIASYFDACSSDSAGKRGMD